MRKSILQKKYPQYDIPQLEDEEEDVKGDSIHSIELEKTTQKLKLTFARSIGWIQQLPNVAAVPPHTYGSNVFATVIFDLYSSSLFVFIALP